MGCAVSKRKTNNLGTLAAGRRVVVSSGSLDGPFLAALQRLNFSPTGETDAPVSTWADGVNQGTQNDMATDKSISQIQQDGK